VALLVCAWGPAQTAHGYENQLTLGAELGYGQILTGTELPAHGLMSGIAASVGINDVWSFRGRLAYTYHPGAAPLHVQVAGAEVLYLLDVLEWVPYFGLGLDGFATVQEGEPGGDLAAHAVVGIEWLASWDWLLGLEVRPYVLPLSLADRGVDPVYLTVNLRASLIFDL
jgi:hypothetical protein